MYLDPEITQAIKGVIGNYNFDIKYKENTSWNRVELKGGKTYVDGQERKLGKTIKALVPDLNDSDLNRILGLLTSTEFEDTIYFKIEDNATEYYTRASKEAGVTSCMTNKPNLTCFYDNQPDIKMIVMFNKKTDKVMARAVLYENVYDETGKRHTLLGAIYPMSRPKYDGAYIRFVKKYYDDIIQYKSGGWGGDGGHGTTLGKPIYYKINYDGKKPQELKLSKFDVLNYYCQLKDGTYIITNSHSKFEAVRGVYYFSQGFDDNTVWLNPGIMTDRADLRKPKKSGRGRPRKIAIAERAEKNVEQNEVLQLLERDETKLFDVYGDLL